MCGLLAAAACMLKDAFPVQSNVTTEFQVTSRKDRDHMDIKKLCNSQDPVKRNSRCALFQIINCCNYTHYTYYVFTSRSCRSRVAGQTRSYHPHDSMDDQFRPVMHAGWLSYIRNTYPDGVATAGPTVLSTAGPADRKL